MNNLAQRPVDQSQWSIMREQGAILVKTGFLPEAIRTPEQAVAIILKGQELGIPPMYALSNIAVIKGKPVANAELMLALIYRDHGDNAIRFKLSDSRQCTIAYRRRSWTQPETYSFTIDDAKQAGLLGNQTWNKYPQAMLRARCISAVARMAFADTIGGLYTPEELGAQVTMTDEGDLRTAGPVYTPDELGEAVTEDGEVIQRAPRLAPPPTETDVQPVQAAEQPRKLKYWSRLNDLVLESKARGLKVDDAEQMQMAGEASIDEITAMGRQLLAAIDAQKAAVQTEDADAELFPAGRP